MTGTTGTTSVIDGRQVHVHERHEQHDRDEQSDHDARDVAIPGPGRRLLDGVVQRGIDVATGPFPRHFGARLVAERRRSKRPLWTVATRSRGTFTLRDLRDAEAGLLPLDAPTVVHLADLYGMRVRDALPPMRRGLEIREGSLHAGGVTVGFHPGDARSMVDAYFRLARTLRSIDDEMTPIGVRHDDLAVIAEHLRATPNAARYLESVLVMAGAERRVVVGGLVAGAAAIDLAGVTEGSIPAAIDVADAEADARADAANPRP